MSSLVSPRNESLTSERAARRGVAGRWFFVSLGAVYLAVAVAGFLPSYLEYFADTFSIHWLAHVHGGLMAAWLLTYLAQTTLAALGNRRLHRRLGVAGIAAGALVWLSMIAASLRVRLELDPPVGHFLWDVFAREVSLILMFPLLLGLALAKRRDAAAHKRLMTIATAVLLQPAIDRMRWIGALMAHSPAFALLFPLLLLALLAPLVVFDLRTRKRLHVATAGGILLVLAAQVLVFLAFGSAAWHELGRALLDVLRR